MKTLKYINIIALLLIFLLPAILFSQITKVERSNQKTELIGQIAPLGDLHISCEKKGNTYTFTYQDAEYQHITEFKSFSFEDVDNAFDNLYQMIIDGFNNPPEDDIMISIPDGYLWLNYTKALGVVNVRFLHSIDKHGTVIGHTIWLTKKKLNKVFGKKKTRKKRKK